MASLFDSKIARKFVPSILATFVFMGGVMGAPKKAQAFNPIAAGIVAGYVVSDSNKRMHQRLEADEKQREEQEAARKQRAEKNEKDSKKWAEIRKKEEARLDALPAVVRSSAEADSVSVRDGETTILHLKTDAMALPLFEGMTRDGEALAFKGEVTLPQGVSAKGAIVVLDEGEVGSRYVLPSARRDLNLTAHQYGHVVLADGSCYRLGVHQDVGAKPDISLEAEDHMSLNGTIGLLEEKASQNPVIGKMLSVAQERQAHLKGQTPAKAPLFFNGRARLSNPNHSH